MSLPIHVYRKVGAGRPSPCRFEPSCSTYALEALHRHGAAVGGWLTVRRLVRCHPWGGHGWDPVPSTPKCRKQVVSQPQPTARAAERSPIAPINRKVFDV